MVNVIPTVCKITCNYDAVISWECLVIFVNEIHNQWFGTDLIWLLILFLGCLSCKKA